jgi:flavin reductase
MTSTATNGCAPAVERSCFLEAMAHLPGAVALITTGKELDRVGLTVSALCSLSADPPSIIACINKNAGAHDEILQRGYFAANILRPDQAALATRFTQKGIDRFADDNWATLATGAPILKSGLMAFDCEIEKPVDGFSHTILIGLVKAIHDPSQEGECLIWHRRRYRSSSDN